MHRLFSTTFRLLLPAVLLAASTSHSAEVVIRRNATPSQSLVVLGDVATVYDINPGRQKQLSATELFPAPAETRQLRLSELQEILILRGVNLSECRFAGASTVTITAAPAVQPASYTQRSSLGAQRSAGDAADQIQKAIAAYLQRMSGASGWKVSLVSNVYASAFPAGATIQQVRGGKAPWTGHQKFEIVTGGQPLQVMANVNIPGMVVTATRALRRGEVLRASDVTLVQQDNIATSENAVSDLSQAVGKQVSRAVRAGAAIDRFDLQAPVLIQRGEAVTLWVRTAGVNIRMATRATGQGAKGDLIELQSLDRKRKYEAVVVDYQVAEIIGESLKTERPSQQKGL